MEPFVGILVFLALFGLIYYSFHLYVRAVNALEKTAHHLDRTASQLTDIIEEMKMEREADRQNITDEELTLAYFYAILAVL